MKLCVYCSSSLKNNRSCFEATEVLAKKIVVNNIHVVCGGGSIWLVGALVDIILQEGGEIEGIIPNCMKELEWSHKGVIKFEFTDTVDERKTKLLQGADGIVLLPGGFGTLKLLFEALALKRLGRFTKPIVILNTNGFFDPVKVMVQNSIYQGFMHENLEKMWSFVDKHHEVLPALRDNLERSHGT